MTVSIARLTAHAGVKYLLKTTMRDDVPLTPGDATGYYMKAGTPPGRWLGKGLEGINRQSLDQVTNGDASAIFTNAEHPDTHQPLGRPHDQTTVAHRNGEEIKRAAVAGFDLTFSVPKSVSVIFALAPKDIQKLILEAHHEAVNEVLEWLEGQAIHTRTGRGGVAHVGAKGAIAAAFDHWESRARDPQLHTHVVIANRVQRATDGAWSSLDSRTLYKATISASVHVPGPPPISRHRPDQMPTLRRVGVEVIVRIRRERGGQWQPVFVAQETSLAVPLGIGCHVSEDRGIHANTNEDADIRHDFRDALN